MKYMGFAMRPQVILVPARGTGPAIAENPGRRDAFASVFLLRKDQGHARRSCSNIGTVAARTSTILIVIYSSGTDGTNIMGHVPHPPSQCRSNASGNTSPCTRNLKMFDRAAIVRIGIADSVSARRTPRSRCRLRHAPSRMAECGILGARSGRGVRSGLDPKMRQRSEDRCHARLRRRLYDR